MLSSRSMTSDAWHCSEADEDGFVDVPYLRERAREGRESFREEFPRPALYVLARTDEDGAEAVDRGGSGVQLLTTALKSVAALKYLGRVAFVAKRPGNPFAHLVSVGRSERNDITIAVDSISKVHGYFTPADDGDGWAFNDHGSTNGSFRGDEKLEPGEKAGLASGDLLRLGVEVTLEVLSPDALYDRVLG